MKKRHLHFVRTGLCALCTVLPGGMGQAGEPVSDPGAVAAFVAPERHSPREQRNLRIAWQFYNAGLNEKDWEKARGFMGDVFDQHSIYAKDQHEGLEDLVRMLRRDHPRNRGELKRAFAAGDMVVMHIHVTRYPGHRGWSVIELVRVENDKVVEHWDIFQPMPEDPANDDGMF